VEAPVDRILRRRGRIGHLAADVAAVHVVVRPVLQIAEAAGGSCPAELTPARGGLTISRVSAGGAVAAFDRTSFKPGFENWAGNFGCPGRSRTGGVGCSVCVRFIAGARVRMERATGVMPLLAELSTGLKILRSPRKPCPARGYP
jgi:hypothetical protein